MTDWDPVVIGITTSRILEKVPDFTEGGTRPKQTRSMHSKEESKHDTLY